MISIMCVMHKSDDYGRILLKQKSKLCLSKTSSKVSDFASTLARFFAWDESEITPALDELLAENVLSIEGDYLVCRRMVRDADLSEKRSKAGKDGGDATQKKNQDAPKRPKKKDDFATEFAKAKVEANTENEIESKTESNYSITTSDTSNGLSYQGGAGGNEKIPPDYIDSIYPDFVAAYGKTKNATQQYKIQQGLLDAVLDCMTRQGCTYTMAGVFLVGCADLARQADDKNRNAFRLAPHNWLAQKCYYSNPLENVVQVSEKETPSEKMKRELTEYHRKRQEKEAQNAQ